MHAQRQPPAAVHHGRYGQVGQREECPSLAYASGVEMLSGHGHHGAGAPRAYLDELCPGSPGEAVALVKKVLQCHDAAALEVVIHSERDVVAVEVHSPYARFAAVVEVGLLVAEEAHACH